MRPQLHANGGEPDVRRGPKCQKDAAHGHGTPLPPPWNAALSMKMGALVWRSKCRSILTWGEKEKR